MFRSISQEREKAKGSIITEAIKKIEELPKDKGCIVVLVGKSASGKTAIAKYATDNFRYDSIVSHTTRPIRPGEQEGVDYYFIGDTAFDVMEREGMFIETTKYRGWKYGISKQELENKEFGIVVTDIVGVRNLKRKGIEHVSIYIERDDKDRFISSILRGDSITEVALRNERDMACYQDVYSEVDYVIKNDCGIEEMVTKLLECVGEYLKK